MPARYMQLDGIAIKLQRIGNNPQKWRVHALWNDILPLYFPTEDNWQVLPKKDELHRKSHYTVSKAEAEDPAARIGILMLEGFGAVASAGTIPTHDQVAYEHWTEAMFEANHGAQKLYLAVCIGLEIKFYRYDKESDNLNPFGGTSHITPLGVMNRAGTRLFGPVNVRDDSENVEDYLVYIQENPLSPRPI